VLLFQARFQVLVLLAQFGRAGWVVAGVGLGEGGAGVLEPGLEFGPEAGGARRLLRGEVMLFADVVRQVVEFVAVVLPIMDELPAVLADDGRGVGALVAIVGVVPEEGRSPMAPPFRSGTRLTPSRRCCGGNATPSRVG